MSDLNTITETLITGDGDKLKELVQSALAAGIPANEILQNGLIVGMDIVGEKMESGEMFIPEVLMSAQAMSISVEILKPLLAEGESASAGKVVIGTVKGDLHDIGKNLVVMMMESAGFEVIDLGVDVEPAKFVEAIRENKPSIVGLSALLTTTMPMMKQSIETIEESGLRDSLKIIVGGAPVNQAFADEVRADGYAPDAGSASKMAKAMNA
ncbi:MAG: cobalamin-binding protein [Desulfobulbaceae bacterium]|nr:cobalamin-binding protein [Desulfobulbaceae bacterium]